MNSRIITKNHAADSKIGSPLKSILEPIGLTSPSRQPGNKSIIAFNLGLKIFLET